MRKAQSLSGAGPFLRSVGDWTDPQRVDTFAAIGQFRTDSILTADRDVIIVWPCIDRSGSNARSHAQDDRELVAPGLAEMPSAGAFAFRPGSSDAERRAKGQPDAAEVGASQAPPATNGDVAQRQSCGSNDAVRAGSSPAVPSKLYAVVRSSLAPGAKACQAAHALRAFQDAYPEVEARWWAESNTLVLLETEQLEELERAAHAAGKTCTRFVEPDWAPDGTLTALVLGPDAKAFVRGLKLALRE
jgi:hypothetical protein